MTSKLLLLKLIEEKIVEQLNVPFQVRVFSFPIAEIRVTTQSLLLNKLQYHEKLVSLTNSRFRLHVSAHFLNC